jgi:ATP-dependent helicase/nuclease subunit A
MIDNIHANIWINANAGSGKTTALVQRFLVLLLNQVPHFEILCITYTKVAANEMKDRIVRKLKSWQDNIDIAQKDIRQIFINSSNESEESIMSKVLLSQTLLTSINESGRDFNISTIHSFCYEILKKNNKYSMTIVTDQKKIELIAKIHKEIYDFDCRGFSKWLSDIFCCDLIGDIEYSLNDAIETISNDLYGVIADTVKNVNKIKNLLLHNCQFDKDFDSGKNIFEIAVSAVVSSDILKYSHIDEEVFLKEEAVKICRNLNLDKLLINRKYITDNEITKFQFILDNSFQNKEEINEFFEILYKLIFTKEGNIRKNLLKNLDDFILYVEEFYSLRNKILFAKRNIAASKISIITLYCYEKFCKIIGALSYEDILYSTLRLLNNVDNSWILYDLDLRISHLLLDEAQDTNLESWQIIAKITEEFFAGHGTKENRTIFCVGDCKQSIFSFQGADPEYLQYYKNYFSQKSRDASIDFIELNLEYSYRSGQEILDIVDNFCNQNPDAFGFGVRHISQRKQKCDIVFEELEVFSEHEIFDSNDSDDNRFKWLERTIKSSTKSDISKLLQSVCDKIDLCLSSGLNKKDIMIIFNNRQAKYGAIFDIVDALEHKYSDVIFIKQFRDDVVLSQVIALFEFIAMPEDNLNLAFLLRSPIFNVDLLLLSHGQSLLSKLINNDSTDVSINTARARIIDLLKCDNIIEAIIFIRSNILLSDCFMKHIYYLDKIYSFAKEYPHKRAFNHFIYDILTNDDIFEDSNCDLNAIRVTTVHSSKGTESEAVIFLNIGEKKFLTDKLLIIDNKLWHNSSAKVVFSELLIYNDFLRKKQKMESLRLLYVAATRAKSKLFIINNRKSLCL